MKKLFLQLRFGFFTPYPDGSRVFYALCPDPWPKTVVIIAKERA